MECFDWRSLSLRDTARVRGRDCDGEDSEEFESQESTDLTAGMDGSDGACGLFQKALGKDI